MIHRHRFASKFGRFLGLEVAMRSGKQVGAAGLVLAVLVLMGVGSLLSACDTVAGAGQDISWFANAVTSDAVQIERAAPPPPPLY